MYVYVHGSHYAFQAILTISSKNKTVVSCVIGCFQNVPVIFLRGWMEARIISAKIDRQLQAYGKEQIVKLLLLGAGESGKSTFVMLIFVTMTKH